MTKHSENNPDSLLFVNTDENLEPYENYACNTEEEYEPYDKSCSSHLCQDGGDGDSEDASIRCSKSVGLRGRIKSWADLQSEDHDHDDHHNASGPIVGVWQERLAPADADTSGPQEPTRAVPKLARAVPPRPAGSQQLPPMAQAPPQGMPVPCALWPPREQVRVYAKQFAPACAHAQV